MQIADDLREQIRSGQLPPGSQLIPRRELAEQYKVATETVRKALDELAAEGLVGSQSTRGTFVLKTPDEPEPSAEYLMVTAELKRLAEQVDGLADRIARLESLSEPPAPSNAPQGAPYDRTDSRSLRRSLGTPEDS